ncbi:MAG: hypothetical protein QX203_05310 [Methylococcaceae bacterium]
MKLKHFEHYEGYCFLLTFENGEVKEADLINLIGHYVPVDALNTAHIDPEWGCLKFPVDALNTAHIDPEWGCLKFNDGRVDIEPKTLYRFATDKPYQELA